MEAVCGEKNNNYSFPGRRRRKKGGNTGYRGPVRKKLILTSNMAMKQQHETAEIATNDTKIG